MTPKQALLSTLHLFVVFAFFAAGLFFVLLPYLPQTRTDLIDLLAQNYHKCTHLGLGFFLTSLLFLLGFYAFNRGRFLEIKMGISSDLLVIRKATQECFSTKFPKKISLKSVEIGSKSRLGFRVHLASLNEADREALYTEVEKELSILLSERFGYTKSFSLIVKV